MNYRKSLLCGGRFIGAGVVCGMVFGSAALAAPPFAEHARSGKSLVVPAEHASKGTVYYALPGRDRQVYFESDAPLEKIKGQSNQVLGYAVAGPDGDPARLAAGEWHLPVASMRTGIAMRDEHLAGKDWLNAAEFPNIVFQVTSVKNVKVLKISEASQTYTVTLVGDMTIHGVTQKMTIPNTTIAFIKGTDRTVKVAKGDLMAIRVKYDVTLKDFGVSHSVIGDKVAQTVQIDTVLYTSTVPPEKQ